MSTSVWFSCGKICSHRFMLYKSKKDSFLFAEQSNMRTDFSFFFFFAKFKNVDIVLICPSVKQVEIHAVNSCLPLRTRIQFAYSWPPTDRIGWFRLSGNIWVNKEIIKKGLIKNWTKIVSHYFNTSRGKKSSWIPIQYVGSKRFYQ